MLQKLIRSQAATLATFMTLQRFWKLLAIKEDTLVWFMNIT